MPSLDPDLESLEERALQRRQACNALREALAAALQPEPSPLPAFTEAPVPRADFSRFAGALSNRSSGLFARWETDVLDPLTDQAVAAEQCQEELLGLREAREQARRRLDVCAERQQAAALALASADVADDISVPGGEGLEPEREEEGKDSTPRRKKKGLGRKIKGLFGHKGKGDKDKEKDKEKEGTGGGQQEDPVQAANDELLECAEEMRQAAEELDVLNERCEAATDKCTKLEREHGCATQDALREAALSLEEWADETRAAVAQSKRHGGDAQSEACESVDSQTQSTAVGASCVSPVSSAAATSDREDDAWFEKQALRLHEENNALMQQLPEMAGVSVADRGVGQGDSDPPMDEVELLLLAKENAEMESALQQQLPVLLAKQVRRCAADLEREVCRLEGIAQACQASARQRAEGETAAAGRQSSPARPGSDLGTPQPARRRSPPDVSSQKSTPKGSPRARPQPQPPPLPATCSPQLESRPVLSQAPAQAAPQTFAARSESGSEAASSLQPPVPVGVSPQSREGVSLAHMLPPEPEPGGGMSHEHEHGPGLSLRDLAAASPSPSPHPLNRDLALAAQFESEGEGQDEVENRSGSEHHSNPFNLDVDEDEEDDDDNEGQDGVNPFNPFSPDGEGDACSLASSDQDQQRHHHSYGQEEASLEKEPEQEQEQEQAGGNPFEDDCTSSPAMRGRAGGGQPQNPFGDTPGDDGLDTLNMTPSTNPFHLHSFADPTGDEDDEDVRRARQPLGDGLDSDLETVDDGESQEPMEEYEGLKGCLPHAHASQPLTKALGLPRLSSQQAAELDKAFSAGDVDAALAASDAAVYARLKKEGVGYWHWEWRDYEAEERHNEMRRCSHLTSLTDDDWGRCSYELLLLLQHSLGPEDPVLEHLRAVLPRFRVSLGIDMRLHRRLSALTLPDGSQSHSPLDVRFRAALLLQSWVRAEAPCLGLPDEEEDDAESGMSWAKLQEIAWVRRQLALLRGSVVSRSSALQRAREAGDARRCGRSCLQLLRQLGEIEAEGRWGRAECGGRRLLAGLLGELDSLGPPEGHWCLGAVFAARVFSCLWVAAADGDATDGLSAEAPAVAAALLQGLQPQLTATPLQVETHALLLAQQLWLSLSAGSSVANSCQLSAPALRTASDMVEDFTTWLQRQDLFSTAGCFARRDSGACVLAEDAAEITARRLLTVELRDGLVRTLVDYRRHLEPEAFSAALSLWMRSHDATRRSEHLVQDSRFRAGLEIKPDWKEEDDAFAKEMGRWFIWSSVTSSAKLAMRPYDLPPGSTAAERTVEAVRTHLEGLATAVQTLMDEIECEREFYHRAWEDLGMGNEHLGIAAAALSASVQPRVVSVLDTGLWPTRDASPREIPAGGGKLVHALESLDRLTRRWKEPQRQAPSLVDLLAPHVLAALRESFDNLDRDIVSHALDGDGEKIFKPMRPPKVLHCEGVVMLWRFVHGGLNAQLELGIPVDIVAQPFVKFLKQVLDRVGARLVRARLDGREAFKLAPRAAQLVKCLADDKFDIESEEDSGGSGGEINTAAARGESSTTKGGSTTAKLGRMLRRKQLEKGKDAEASYLDVDPEVTRPSVQEICVRLSSLGCCLAEVGNLHNRLQSEVSSGDGSECLSMRHYGSLISTCQELRDIHDELQERAQMLARHLANRLVYVELRQPIFNQLYSSSRMPVVAATPQASGCTPGQESPSHFGQCLTLEMLVAQRQDSFRTLLRQAPTPVLLAFTVELGMQLIHSWAYVVLVNLRQQQLADVCPYVDDDQKALRRLLVLLMEEVRQRISDDQASGQLHALSKEDWDDGQKRLDAAIEKAEKLVLKVSCGSKQELAKYAARIFGELAPVDAAPVPAPAAVQVQAEQKSARARSPKSSGGASRTAARSSGRSPSPQVSTDAGHSTQAASTRCSSPSSARTGHGHHHRKPGWKRTMGGVAKLWRGGQTSKS